MKIYANNSTFKRSDDNLIKNLVGKDVWIKMATIRGGEHYPEKHIFATGKLNIFWARIIEYTDKYLCVDCIDYDDCVKDNGFVVTERAKEFLLEYARSYLYFDQYHIAVMRPLEILATDELLIVDNENGADV